jgi:glycosyltransferase involved in cell wall biosynthesis
LAKAKIIISVSEYTKKTLVEKLGIKPEKIKVIYSGAPEVSFKSLRLPKELKKGEYILNQGGMDIRKNLNRLIRAFAKVKLQNSKTPKLKTNALKLVITGENQRMKKNLEKEIWRLGISKAVVFSGYVDEERLWSLIRQASCVCYPSLIEGFGGPVLEGFAAAVPVICSNVSSLPEIAGDAAFLVNPESEEEIAEAILKIVEDNSLREKLVEKGKERLKDFSWKKTAEEVMKIYGAMADG